MREILLSQGKIALIDDEDYARLNQHRWFAHRNRYGDFYAVRTAKGERKGKIIRMHREVLRAPTGQVVDHINHNGLDNRKDNLRLCSHAQNLANQKPQNGCSSEFKAVSWDRQRKKWHAYIHVNSKRKHIGRFENEMMAAIAYDRAAIAYFGEFACTNLV